MKTKKRKPIPLLREYLAHLNQQPKQIRQAAISDLALRIYNLSYRERKITRFEEQ